MIEISNEAQEFYTIQRLGCDDRQVFSNPEVGGAMDKSEEERRCGFCGLPRSVTGPLVQGGPRGNKVFICGDCCIRGTNYLDEWHRRKRGEIEGTDPALPSLRLADTGTGEAAGDHLDSDPHEKGGHGRRD